jgi:hypothetical protein
VEKQHDIVHFMVRPWLKEASLPKTLWFKASVAPVFEEIWYETHGRQSQSS